MPEIWFRGRGMIWQYLVPAKPRKTLLWGKVYVQIVVHWVAKVQPPRYAAGVCLGCCAGNGCSGKFSKAVCCKYVTSVVGTHD